MINLLILLSLILNTGILIFYIGLLSNWFRYSLSLESTIVVIILSLIYAIFLVFHFFVFYKIKFSKITVGVLLSSIIFFGVSTLLIKQTQGIFFPKLKFNDIQTNGYQKLPIKKGVLEYKLMLINPFSVKHLEILVIKINGKTQNFYIPLFPEKKMGGFLSANVPSDWCELKKTEDQNIFELRTTSFLRKNVFFINLINNTVKEVK